MLSNDLIHQLLWTALERISRLWWWTSPDPDWGWHDRINAAARRARETGSTIQLRSLIQLWEAVEAKRIEQHIASLRPQATAWPATVQQECGRLINRYEVLGQSHEAAVQRAFDEITRGLQSTASNIIPDAIPASN